MKSTSETVRSDALRVVEPRTAGLDVHKLQVTASTRPCDRPLQPAGIHSRRYARGPASSLDSTHPTILSCDADRALAGFAFGRGQEEPDPAFAARASSRARFRLLRGSWPACGSSSATDENGQSNGGSIVAGNRLGPECVARLFLRNSDPTHWGYTVDALKSEKVEQTLLERLTAHEFLAVRGS